MPDNIERTVRAAADHGAHFVGSGLLHVGPDVRTYFLGFLEREYPDLLGTYRQLYGGKYPPKRYQAAVDGRVRVAKAAVGFAETHHRRVERPAEPIQLALPLGEK